MDVYKQTKDILKKYNIHANKNLGQNFLIDSNIIDSIIGSSNITGQDLVIEIGPGLGTLTESLLEKAYKVICIELDKKMVNILHERFEKYDSIEILNEDILKVDLNKLIKEQRQKGKFEKVKIVANLPYYITTPIIMKLLENNLDIYSITIMVQLEVADTILQPGEQKEVKLILSKAMTENNTGLVNNIAEIYEIYNDKAVPDISSTPGNKVQGEDDMDNADLLISIQTGEIYLYIITGIVATGMLIIGIYFINKKVLIQK